MMAEYTQFMAELIRMLKYDTYLELGISEAKNIHQMSLYCKKCVGVDIIDIRHYRDFDFYQMTTDDFFSTNDDLFDVIFIDADHSFSQCKIDFANSLKVLNNFGIIILHDTDPADNTLLDKKHCSNSYNMIDWLKIFHPELDTFTLPVSNAGMTLVNRKKDRRIYGYLIT